MGINQLQLGKLDDSISQARRLASATEKANANVVEADRPWLGASYLVNKFGENQTPSFTVAFTNSGHRPAIIDSIKIHQYGYKIFPADPEKEYFTETIASTSFAVPGQPIVSWLVAKAPLAANDMRLFESSVFTYYVFGRIVYRDIKTNKTHWTHMCLLYVPKEKTDSDPGFRNCPTYNDAN